MPEKEMRKYQISIRGISPYMQHRMITQILVDANESRGKIIENKGKNLTDMEKARQCAYFDEKGYYIPKEHLFYCMVNGAGYHKAKVGNASRNMKNIVAGQFHIEESKFHMHPLDVIDEIDVRTGVNQNIKGRVVIVRPKWKNWGFTFTLCIDNTTLTDQQIGDIIVSAGSYVGMGSYRPQHLGEFGRFEITKFIRL
jgi:hypothetical protein